MGVSKKAQVSLFILIGLLIVTGAAIFFYYQNVEQVEPFTDPLTPVERYITDCLDDTARGAFVRVGLQGGYITLPENMYRLPSSYMQDMPGAARTPLWLHRGQTIIPPRQTIEQQTAEYIAASVGSCIQTVETLEGVAVLSFDDTPNATVTLTQEDVVVSLNYTITLEQGNVEQQYTRFATRVPVRFEKIMNSAAYLVERHYTDAFLDRTTMNIISMDEDMPIGSVDFSCRRLRWSVREIEHSLKETLQSIIPRVRVSGADSLPYQEPLAVYQRIERDWDLDRLEREGLPDNLPDDSYEYFQQRWMVDHDFEGMSVGFSYFPQYGMNLGINPSSGDRLTANPGRSSYLRFFCLNIYHFTYNIEYPVKVNLYDPTAFNGEGYTFSFGLPVTIARNIPTRDPVNFHQMEALETSEEFCETTGDDVFILANDVFTGDYITGVNITYDCLKYYCELGETDFFSGFNVPQIQTGLPLGCYNGFFMAEKEGYVPIRRQMGDVTGTVSLGMVPLQQFYFEPTLLGGEVTSDYTISIYLNAKNYDYEVYTTYPIPEGEPILELISGPAEYEVEILAMSGDTLVGGWIGNLSTTMGDLMGDTITFNLYEQVPHPQTSEQQITLFGYLDEDLPSTDAWYPYRERLPIQFR